MSYYKVYIVIKLLFQPSKISCGICTAGSVSQQTPFPRGTREHSEIHPAECWVSFDPSRRTPAQQVSAAIPEFPLWEANGER